MNLLNAYQEKGAWRKKPCAWSAMGKPSSSPRGWRTAYPPRSSGRLTEGVCGVTVAQLLPLRKFDYFDPSTVEHVRHLSYFFSAATRSGGQEGWIDYVPAYFSELPMLLDRRLLAADVVFTWPRPWTATVTSPCPSPPTTPWPQSAGRKPWSSEVNPNVPFAHGNCHGTSPRSRRWWKTTTGSRSRAASGRSRAAVHRQVCRRSDPRRGDFADRLRQHPRRRGHATHRQARPGNPHRNDRQRHHDPGRKRRRYQPAQELSPGQDARELCPRRPQALPLHAPQSGLGDASGGFHERPYLAGQNDNLIAINGTMQVDLVGQCGSETTASCPIRAPAAD